MHGIMHGACSGAWGRRAHALALGLGSAREVPQAWLPSAGCARTCMRIGAWSVLDSQHVADWSGLWFENVHVSSTGTSEGRRSEGTETRRSIKHDGMHEACTMHHDFVRMGVDVIYTDFSAGLTQHQPLSAFLQAHHHLSREVDLQRALLAARRLLWRV